MGLASGAAVLVGLCEQSVLLSKHIGHPCRHRAPARVVRAMSRLQGTKGVKLTFAAQLPLLGFARVLVTQLICVHAGSWTA